MSGSEVPGQESQGEVLDEKRIAEPPRFRVLLHNDNYTTYGFVINILCQVFNKNLQDASVITEHVHNKGIGVCGIYTQEVAEAKVTRVRREARSAGFPLQCTMEEA